MTTMSPPPARLTDVEVLKLWRSVQGPRAGLNGPLIRFAALVAEAALAAEPEAQGWQPMEMVPPDVEFIIASWRIHDVVDGWVNDVGEAWRDGAIWFSAFGNEPIEPTHWMPLPAPPAPGDTR